MRTFAMILLVASFSLGCAGDEPRAHTARAALEAPLAALRRRAAPTPIVRPAVHAILTEEAVPAAPVLDATRPRSPSSERCPTIFGRAVPGSTVALYGEADCRGPVLASVRAYGTGSFLVSVCIAGTTNFSAHAEGAGRPSVCSAPFQYVLTESTPTGGTTWPSTPPPSTDSSANAGSSDTGSSSTTDWSSNGSSDSSGSSAYPGWDNSSSDSSGTTTTTDTGSSSSSDTWGSSSSSTDYGYDSDPDSDWGDQADTGSDTYDYSDSTYDSGYDSSSDSSSDSSYDSWDW